MAALSEIVNYQEYGPHEVDGRKFLYDPHEAKKMFIDEQAEREAPLEMDEQEENAEDESSSSSTTSEEMIPEEDPGELADDDDLLVEKETEIFYMKEFELTEDDFAWLAKNNNEKKANVWLSRKMMEKSKEVTWSKLPLEEKQKFDLAQAKELSQVATSQALRNLTAEEEATLDLSKVMNMRWVLTFKGDGSSKARLVVLGFQAHNLTSVETASPTMSKTGRNVLLAITSNLKLKCNTGDVSSAFLQTHESLEDQELTVWAPPELAVMFGARPEDPRALRVLRAFYGLVHAPRKWYESVISTMVSQGWKQLQGDKCLLVLLDEKKEMAGLAGIHVDDFLLSGREGSLVYKQAEEKLRQTFRFGKWESASSATGVEFAGCRIRQLPDYSIYLDQKDYVEKWVEEISINPQRSRKAELLPSEVSDLRAALGTASWRATQSGPQYLADTSLLLSEVSRGTVETLYKVNKLIREMKKNAQQGLKFPAWGLPLTQLAVITWADASNHNRPDRASTIGTLTGIGPAGLLRGEEHDIALLQWKSGKTPRQCLGSNGAEVQSITIGEDQNYKIRGLVFEMTGEELRRDAIHEQVATIEGGLVMDSRGIYDAATRNLSALHGLRDSRAGYELTVSINQARRARTELRWVNGLAQLADGLTKAENRKTFLSFFTKNQYWRLIHDESFTAGRKLHKKELERQLKAQQESFVSWVKSQAEAFHWPWDEGPLLHYDAFS